MEPPDSAKSQIRGLLKKADRSLAAASTLLQEGNPDFASSRAYYAAFYSIEALLLFEGKTFSSHSALLSAFGLHFLKTDILPRELGRIVQRLFRNRQEADYGIGERPGEDEAREDINLARQVVDTISEYLKPFLKK